MMNISQICFDVETQEDMLIESAEYFSILTSSSDRIVISPNIVSVFIIDTDESKFDLQANIIPT